MKQINEIGIKAENRPVKFMQFGEGNFLRAFVDYMIDIANEKGEINGNVAIIKPIDFGNLERFKNQDNLYTVVLRGKQNGKVVDTSRIIKSISKALSAREDYDEMMALAISDDLRFVISNTTEAGIVLDENDHFDGLPETYPGKLTKILYERFKKFNGDSNKGLIILPVELIENNGGKLKECVLSLAKIWKFPDEFTDWVNTACVFCSTLVDRIVTGYPGEEAEKICQKLGYKDELLDVGEPFALWVIESDQDIRNELPLDKAGLPVIFTKDQKPYRERKVRVLNGAHTSSVLISYLYGIDIVRDIMHDCVFGTFLKKTVDSEIVPLVPLDTANVKQFAESVYERFENPFIDHKLLSISLNSVSKWKARVLPSFKANYDKNGKIPKLLTFSFASLLAFYRSTDLKENGLVNKRNDGTEYTVLDDRAVLEFISQNAAKSTKEYVEAVAGNTSFWVEDLRDYKNFVNDVTKYVDMIKEDPYKAVNYILG